MVSNNAREEWLSGYKKSLEGLNELEDWMASASNDESMGALATIVFYGACIREIINKGIDDPLQASIPALAILEFFEEDDFESVISYLAGKPLPSRLTDMIEHYKAKFQADVSNAMNTLDNIEISFEDDDDEG